VSFPDRRVTVVAPDSLRLASSVPPEQRFTMQRVCATGLVSHGLQGDEMTVDAPSRVRVEEVVIPPFETDAHWPCEDEVTNPSVLREVKPAYTAELMRRRAEGRVQLQGVVEPDGRVGAVRVTRSLDPLMDEAMVKAFKGWQFTPGTFRGKPAAVVVSAEMTFVMRH
jgi:TonB family protein